MKYLLLLLFGLVSFSSLAQDSYADSLLDFQHHYKVELFDIIKEDTAFVRFYAPDKQYCVQAKVQLLKNQRFFAMRTSSGQSHLARKYATVTFQLKGKEFSLTAYQLQFVIEAEATKDYFFIPFLDQGSGELTYSGGRYLDFKTTDIVNDSLLIDFNKAYNPYCAFTTGYSCPIPPGENTLETVMKAGERMFMRE